MYVCVCVCERVRERMICKCVCVGDRCNVRGWVFVGERYLCACVCACVRVREMPRSGKLSAVQGNFPIIEIVLENIFISRQV